jgi:hypothetical protein
VPRNNIWLLPLRKVTALLPLLQSLPAGQCPTSADLDLIEGVNTRVERLAKEWINNQSPGERAMAPIDA